MTRHRLRLLSIAALFAACALFIYLGFQGWVIYDILPVQNLGYLLALAGILGLLGVNIWFGGPLDPKRDQLLRPSPSQSRPDFSIQDRWQAAQSTIQDWGQTWQVIPSGSGLQQELAKELSTGHPLSDLAPVIFGRCQNCDDVVAAVLHETPFAVIHLTWRGRPEQEGWPSFILLTADEFFDRFLRLGEHS